MRTQRCHEFGTAGAGANYPRAASKTEVQRVRVERGGDQDRLQRRRQIFALVITSGLVHPAPLLDLRGSLFARQTTVRTLVARVCNKSLTRV